MRAVILAAGTGSRLRPYTDDRPKCMVELAGKPVLHRQLDVLRAAGIADILIVGGYRADRIDAPGVRMVVNPRYAETNMVSTLFCAEEWLRRGDDVLICYGDIVYEPRVLESVDGTDASLGVAVDREWLRLWKLRMDNPLDDAETLKLDASGDIIELGKKPTNYGDIQGQYIGLIKVRADHVEKLCRAWHELDRCMTYDGKNVDNMYMTSFLQNLIDSGWRAQAAFTDNGWLEIDTAEDLEKYQGMHRDGSLGRFIELAN